MGDKGFLSTLPHRGGTVFFLTVRQIVKSKSTLVVLLLCLIPFLLSVAWSSGWTADDTIYENQVEIYWQPADDNTIAVAINQARMDFREEGDTVIIEREVRGTSSDFSNLSGGVDAVKVGFMVKPGSAMDSGMDSGEEFPSFGELYGVTLQSLDLNETPPDLREDFIRSLNNTPDEFLLDLVDRTLLNYEESYLGLMGDIDIKQLIDEYGFRSGDGVADGNGSEPGGGGDGSPGDEGEDGGGGLPWDLSGLEGLTPTELVMSMLPAGLMEYSWDSRDFGLSTQLFLFGTGPGGLDDWSTWRCYVIQRLPLVQDDNDLKDMLDGLGSDEWMVHYDEIPLQVDRGEVSGYAGARAVERGYDWNDEPDVPDPFGQIVGDGREEPEDEEEDVERFDRYANDWRALEFREPDPDDEWGYDIFQEVAGHLYLFFIIPITCLLYATVSITNEVTSRTMTYLTSRPMSRYELYTYRFFGYYAATLLVTLPPLLATFFMFGVQSGDYAGHWDILSTYLIVSSLYILMLGGLFFAFCTITSYPLVLGLIYMFFWEAAISQTPFYIRKFTLNFHMRSIIDERLGDAAIIHAYEPPDLGDSYITMAVVFVAFIIFGMLVFSRREYH